MLEVSIPETPCLYSTVVRTRIVSGTHISVHPSCSVLTLCLAASYGETCSHSHFSLDAKFPLSLFCCCRMEEVANCSLVLQTMLSVLRGSNYPQYVASFGNSPLEYPLDWIPVRSNFNPGVRKTLCPQNIINFFQFWHQFLALKYNHDTWIFFKSKRVHTPWVGVNTYNLRPY